MRRAAFEEGPRLVGTDSASQSAWPDGGEAFVPFGHGDIPLCGTGSFARSGKGTKALLRGGAPKNPVDWVEVVRHHKGN